jgi:hypothetical membrane protein
MLQQLAANTADTEPWVIGSMLFFFLVFMAVVIRVITRRAGHYDRQAQLPLEDLGNERDGGM